MSRDHSNYSIVEIRILRLKETCCHTDFSGKPTNVGVKNFQMSKIIILFTNPSARVGYDTRSIFFKWSLTGLNSEFFFLLD